MHLATNFQIRGEGHETHEFRKGRLPGEAYDRLMSGQARFQVVLTTGSQVGVGNNICASVRYAALLKPGEVTEAPNRQTYCGSLSRVPRNSTRSSGLISEHVQQPASPIVSSKSASRLSSTSRTPCSPPAARPQQ